MDFTLLELDDWCTVGAAARAEDVSYPTLLNWIRSGRLPAIKLGRSYLVRRSELGQVATESRRYYGGQRKGGRATAVNRMRAGAD